EAVAEALRRELGGVLDPAVGVRARRAARLLRLRHGLDRGDRGLVLLRLAARGARGRVAGVRGGGEGEPGEHPEREGGAELHGAAFLSRMGWKSTLPSSRYRARPRIRRGSHGIEKYWSSPEPISSFPPSISHRMAI